MTHREALQILSRHRSEAIVIPTMGSVGLWPEFSDMPLDFHYLPSSMGQGIALGLGLALAQPTRTVIVLSGDGSLLMNLGCLATVGEYPASLKIILINNGLYEVTGGQTPVGAGRVDFAAIGRACGISNVVDFSQLSEWSRHASNLLSQPGPALIVLRVAGRPGQKTPSAPRPMSEQIERLTQALGS